MLDPSIDNDPWSVAKKTKNDSILEGNGTLVQILFPILLRRQVGMLEKTVDGPCCSQTTGACFPLTKISFMDFSLAYST